MREMFFFTLIGFVWLFIVALMFATPISPDPSAVNDYNYFWYKVGSGNYYTTLKDCQNICLQANERGLICKCQQKQKKFRPLIIY